MSIPINPLDKFQSHAYHFILLAANNTESLRKLSDGRGLLSNVATAKLGDDIGGGSFLICDTRRISELAINSVKFKQYLGVGSPSETHLICGLLEMEMYDPTGIGLLNYLKILIDEKLKTDITGMVFMLHISFIGHTDTGGTEPVDSINILMFLTDMILDFSHTGGRYSMKFAPADSGTHSEGAHGDYFKIYSAFNIYSPDNTLGAAIKSFENQLNAHSLKAFQQLNAQQRDPATDQVQGSKDQKYGRLVQYMITLPEKVEGKPNSEDWATFPINAVQNNQVETDFKKRAQEQKDTNTPKTNVPTTPTDYNKNVEDVTGMRVSIPVSGSISDALTTIFQTCDRVQAKGNAQAILDKKASIYKILYTITSDEKTVLVHVDVVEYYLPDPEGLKKIKEGVEGSGTKLAAKEDNPPGAYIYDYLYTGKNADIIDFAVQVNNAQFMLLNKVSIGAKALADVQDSDSSKKKDKDNLTEYKPVGVLKPNSPVKPPVRTPQETTNYVAQPNPYAELYPQVVADRQDFHQLLSYVHGMSMLNGVVKIRGNPDHLGKTQPLAYAPHMQLMGSYNDFTNIQNFDDQGVQQKLAENRAQHRKYVNDNFVKPRQDTIDLAASGQSVETETFHTSPYFLKINIKAPSDYLFSQEVGTGNVQVFYDGWYMMRAIEHEFNMGNFTQTLEIAAYNLGEQEIKAYHDYQTTVAQNQTNANKPPTK